MPACAASGELTARAIVCAENKSFLNSCLRKIAVCVKKYQTRQIQKGKQIKTYKKPIRTCKKPKKYE